MDRQIGRCTCSPHGIQNRGIEGSDETGRVVISALVNQRRWVRLSIYIYIYACIYIYIHSVVAWGSPEGNWSSLLSTLKDGFVHCVLHMYIYVYIYMYTYYIYIHTQYMLLFDSSSADPIEIESILKFRCDKSWSPDLEIVMVAKLTSWHGMLSGWWGC